MNKKAVQKPRILNPSQNSVAEDRTTQVMEMGGGFEVEVGMGGLGRWKCELATSRHMKITYGNWIILSLL